MVHERDLCLRRVTSVTRPPHRASRRDYRRAHEGRAGRRRSHTTAAGNHALYQSPLVRSASLLHECRWGCREEAPSAPDELWSAHAKEPGARKATAGACRDHHLTLASGRELSWPLRTTAARETPATWCHAIERRLASASRARSLSSCFCKPAEPRGASRRGDMVGVADHIIDCTAVGLAMALALLGDDPRELTYILTVM